jgi:hypothetical protein
MTQEKKNIRLAISLGVLLTLLAVAYLLRPGSNRSQVDPLLFRLPESTEVNKVVLQQGGETATLAYDDVRWLVNDSLEADRQMIKVLFATIEQAQAKKAVASTQRDSIANQLKRQGVRVTFFAGTEAVKEMWVGGNAAKTISWFMSPDDQQPYVVTIPGYHVYVAGIFEQTSQQWRDKRVFNFNWRNFKSLTADFPKEPAQNFTITMKERYFGIEGVSEIDTTRLNDYLDALSLLEAAAYYQKGKNRLYDSLLLVPPSFSIVVRDIGDREHLLTIYPPVRNHDTVVGQNGKDRMLFPKGSIVQIAKKRSFFQKVEEPR